MQPDTPHPTQQPTRRELWARSASWIGGLIAASSLAGCRSEAAAARDILALLGGELALLDPLAIGRSVVEASPAGLDPMDLWRRTLQGLPLEDPGRFVSMWRERCREDFEAGRRLNVRGWHLALGEGMLCAALVLDQQEGLERRE